MPTLDQYSDESWTPSRWRVVWWEYYEDGTNNFLGITFTNEAAAERTAKDMKRLGYQQVEVRAY